MAEALAAAPPGADAIAERRRLTELANLYKKSRVPVRRKHYANPRQYYDHILLADAYSNTFAGEVIDTRVDFMMGGGVHPALRLRRPSGDPDQDKSELEAGQEVIDELVQIDEWYSDMGAETQDPWFDVPLDEKFRDCMTSMEVFGRSCIVKEKWTHVPSVETDKEEYPQLPNVLKPIHPIEMGLTETELYTGKVAGVWLANEQPYVPADEMLYFVNSFSSPMIGTHTYGFTAAPALHRPGPGCTGACSPRTFPSS